MSYAKNIEKYRRQLIANATYQNIRWFAWGTPTKMAFRDKLRRYAKKAGVDYLGMCDAVEEIVVPGGLGARRRAQAGEYRRIQPPRRTVNVFRKGYMLGSELTALKYKMMASGAMPVEPIDALSVPAFQEVIFICNRNRGELHILDHERTVKVIPWASVEDVSKEAFYEAWGGIEIEPVSFLGEDNRPLEPMFHKGRGLTPSPI